MSQREIRIAVTDGGVEADELAELTRHLARFVNDYAPDCDARPAPALEAAPAGAKGGGVLEATMLGSLVVLLFQSGAVKQLIDSVSTFLQANRATVKVTLTGADGAQITIDRKVKDSELEAFVERFRGEEPHA